MTGAGDARRGGRGGGWYHSYEMALDRRVHNSGFVMGAVVGSLFLVAVLLGSVHFMARQQNRMAHRIAFGEVAYHLARSGAELVSRKLRDGLLPRRLPAVNLDLRNGPLSLLFLLDPDTLQEELRDRGRSESFLRQILGEDYRFPLDTLERRFPPSSIEVFLEGTARPLHDEDSGLTDPVEKVVDLTVTSRATYRGIARTVRTGYQLKVVNPFAPVVCRFTLFVPRAAGGYAYNAFLNDEAGLPYAGSPVRPVVLDNTPETELDDLVLMEENQSNIAAGNPFAQRSQLANELGRRGHVYLGTAPGDPDIHLNLAAGPVLSGGGGRGEFFQLFNMLPPSLGGYDAQPGYFSVIDPPDFFRNPVRDPVNDLDQKANVNFLYWGFHHPGQNDLRDGTLGSSLVTEDSSLLQLFGTTYAPSRTVVWGPVRRDYVRFGYLALDRDDRDNDEQTQAANLAASGLPTEVRARDTIDPIFKFVADEGTWRDELDREAGGRPFSRLADIPPSVCNLNHTAGPGCSLLGPIIDPGHPVVPLDPARYTYRNMFGEGFDDLSVPVAERKGYSRFMSQVESIYYNRILDFMYYSDVIPPESHPAYQAPTLPPSEDTTLDTFESYYEGNLAVFYWNDPLHRILGVEHYYKGDFPDFFEPRGGAPPLVESILEARSYREYLTVGEFLADTYDPSLNLFTLTQCVIIREGDLTVPAGARYIGSGAVVLRSGDLRLQGLTSFPDPATGLPSLATFATLSGNLIFTGPAGLPTPPNRGLFLAPRGSVQTSATSSLEIEGSLAARHLPPGSLTRGGRIAYRGECDPITWREEEDQASYVDYYQMALSDAPVTWERNQAQE